MPCAVEEFIFYFLRKNLKCVITPMQMIPSVMYSGITRQFRIKTAAKILEIIAKTV